MLGGSPDLIGHYTAGITYPNSGGLIETFQSELPCNITASIFHNNKLSQCIYIQHTMGQIPLFTFTSQAQYHFPLSAFIQQQYTVVVWCQLFQLKLVSEWNCIKSSF